MTAVILFITITLIGITLIAIINALIFPRITGKKPVTTPNVSILIPARNEAAVIGDTVRLLLAQTYPNFELILLNDQSKDQTASLALAAANGDDRLLVLPGQPLPAGWAGKNWACQQLATEAQGDYLIFTDADVQWQPDALAGLMDEMTRSHADLLTVWPTQQCETWGERLVVPLIALAVLAYLPVPAVHYLPNAAFAAANGQCMAFQRAAYEALGGHRAIRQSVLDDVHLARLVKANGLRLRMADGATQIKCRMYDCWSDVRDGFAKNILAGYGGSIILLAIATVFHWLIFVLPWIWLVLGWFIIDLAGWPVWPILAMALGIGVRMLTAAISRQRLLDALVMPVSVVLMTLIAIQSIWWQWRYGGPRWKGRTLPQ